MIDAELFAPPPEKPEIYTPREVARFILFYEWERFSGWAGFICSAGWIVLPIILMFAGAYTGRSFFSGLLLTAVVVAVVAAAPIAVAWPIDVSQNLAHQEAARAAYARDFAAWEARAPARAAVRRRDHGLALFEGLLKEAAEKRMQPVLAARQAAQRRAFLEAQLAEIFRQYRLRNDWDASDATLVPRLQAAFRKWVQEKPPFPPQDMALLATSADAATRALLPAPTASRS